MAEDNPYDSVVQTMPNPRGLASLFSDSDPDKAAQALKLSQGTGVPAPVINNDVDGFAAKLKAKTAGDIAASNPQIGKYVTSDPMAAKVSSDDYAQLDSVSQATTKLAQPGIFESIGKAWNEGFDFQGQHDEAQRLYNFVDSPTWRSFVGHWLGPGAGLLSGMNNTLTGALYAGSAGISAAYDKLGGQEAYQNLTGKLPPNLFGNAPSGSSDSLMRDLIPMANMAMVAATPGMAGAKGFIPPELNAAAAAVDKAKPFLADAKPIPVGVDPIIDAAKKEESAADLDRLKQAMTEAQGSATRERAPDMFRSFIAQHTGESTVGISADAIEKLYGDKAPTADDGILGFVPDIASQLEQAKATGADVQVPIADMLAKMDPEVFNQVVDGVRVKPDGLTQGEELPKVEGKVEEADPVQTIRAAAGLEPSKTIPMAAGPDETISGEASGQLFDKANAIGMTEAQYSRYSKLIADQQEADREAAQRRAEAFEKRTQTPEWNANRKEMFSDVANEVSQQPRFMADQGIRRGDIPKLDADSLTDEQKAGLPKAYYKRGGESPDYVAKILGYESGDEMVKDLQALTIDRGDAKPGEYITKLINDETDRRMAAQYGKLDENVIEAAKEQVLSETQLDLLHAQVEDLAGGKVPFTKEDLRQSMARMVGETKLGSISSDAMLAAAGRAGRAAEDALLKGDPAEAFRQRQRQYAAVMHAKESMKVEKAKGQFDKLAKAYQKREVPGALQEYTNQIHDLLVRLGQPVRRSVQDIAESTELDGYASFDDFVKAKEGSFRELHVPDFLRDPSFRKPVESLTADEFMQTNSALKALAFNARDEAKIIRAGEKVDFKATLKEMTDQLATLGPAKTPTKTLQTIRTAGWSGINLESMLNRFDRDDPMGVFNQTLVRSYTEAANYKDRLLKQFGEKLNATGRIPDINKAVRNDLFIDPITRVPITFSRRNVLGVLQNIGNDSNLAKLAGGYGLTPEGVKQWLFQNTTKEDWDRAQHIGNTFNEVFDMANTMSHNVSGVGIQRLPLTPIDTPFGRYDGWYNPVQYSDVFLGKSKVKLGSNALEQEGYYRATTPQGYTKGRTGYIAPVELNLDIVPVRMRQMIHDVAMRPALIQLSKFFTNPEFRQAIISHYGKIQGDMLEPFLRDMANSPNFRSQAENILGQAFGEIQHNTVGTLIGLNPSTVMKHGSTALVNSLSQVGVVPWAREFSTLMKSDPATGNSNWSMAMEKSDELNRRMKNFQEIIANSGREIALQTSGPGSLLKDVRSVAQYAGSFPVSASDLLSSVPTWLASYKHAIDEGMDEGQAKFLADRDVRMAHGSSVLTNKSALQRGNSLGQTFSSLYGFFSHMLQKQYEIAWRTKDAFGLAREGNLADATKGVPKIAGMIVSYVVIPALIEELVTPHTSSTNESWGMKAGKVLAGGMASSFIGVRDFASALLNGRDPSPGLVGTEMKAYSDTIRDLASGKAFTVAKAGDFLKHATVLAGVATGLTNAQEGKSAEFIYNYFHNREHPQGPWQWATGLRYGKTKGHSKSFDDWKKQEVEQ